ncbi:hypothetical protein WN55_00437 [Dufourea novaeangliae]|uniref:Uncharacterized protein n=1 Tax=Dufourea novaeangliae TaxID=178035 RepID=A0A154PFR6_DUFNO|nr:hypothetical protein WN55_00437 [Dufourea novaeangliae]
MEDSKVKSLDLTETMDMTDTSIDITTSKNEREKVEKHVDDVSNENNVETNDSYDKKSDLIIDLDIKEQEISIELEESKATEKMTAETENDSQTSSKEEVISNVMHEEIDNKAEKSESNNSTVKANESQSLTNVSEAENALNEISKVVDESLNSEDVQESLVDSKDMKEEDKDSVGDSKQKTDEISIIEDVTEVIASEKINNVPVETQKKQTIEEEEDAEVGIVGPPTTVSELIHEEELRAESSLSTDPKVKDHVAEWVQNSAKGEELITEEEEETPVQHIQEENKNVREKRTRKKKNNDVLALPTRKSQRIVSNIIKKSIKW